MSFAKWWEIYCDADKCAESQVLEHSSTKTQAIKEARKEGWSLGSDKVWRCPECAEKRRKNHD